ncbi:uncharacterized protein J3R85_007499 [Psidium guajava]|nr:uncharacterized protein J3R85_007499 [Psidium guajava]
MLHESKQPNRRRGPRVWAGECAGQRSLVGLQGMKTMVVSGPWIGMRWTDGGLGFSVVRIQEAVGLGQRIKRYEIYVDGKKIAQGTTVGYKKLHRLKGGVVHGSVVRVRITESKGLPLISSIGLHFGPFWQPMDGKWR